MEMAITETQSRPFIKLRIFTFCLLLTIAFRTGAARAQDAQSLPLVPPLPPPVATAATAATFLGVEPQPSATTIRVLVRLNQQVPRKVSTLSDPTRLVIDLTGASATMDVPFVVPIGDPQVTQVRVGAPKPDQLRLVFDLRYLTPYTVKDVPGAADFVVDIARGIPRKDTSETIAKGYVYEFHQGMYDTGPLTWHLLDVDLAAAKPVFRVAMGNDRVCGREELSSIVGRKGAIAGINGGYFGMKTNLPIDMLIVGGRILSLPDRYRAFFGFDGQGKPAFLYPHVEMSVQFNDQKRSRVVDGLNRPPLKDELVLFTPEFGTSTVSPPGFVDTLVRNRKLDNVREGAGFIPYDGYVLTADAPLFASISRLFSTDTSVRVMVSSYPDMSDIRDGFTAGPMLVYNGQPVNTSIEDFTRNSSITAGRAPRTAVGLTKNNHLLFFVVEGRSQTSSGLSLDELANLLLTRNVLHGINLDGGGSTELVVKGRVMNSVSDGRERPINNAILIFPEGAASP